jgi:hypothetical protein
MLGDLTMSDQKQKDGPGPLILFPEVIGISILALLLPLPLAHMLISGQVLMGILGFAAWLAALFFAVLFIRRRQYALVWLPMLVMVGLFFVIRKLSD